MAQSHKPDLTKISLKEYRSLFDKSQPQEEEDALLARVFGFESGEQMVTELTQPEFKRLLDEMLRMARDPVENDEKN